MQHRGDNEQDRPSNFPDTTIFVEEHKKEGVDVHTDNSTDYIESHGPHETLIYSAPTLDTLGDETASIRPHGWHVDAQRQHTTNAPQNFPDDQEAAASVHPLKRSSRTSTPVRGSLTSADVHTLQTPDRTPPKQRATSRGSQLIHRSTVPPSPFRQKSTTPNSNKSNNSATYFRLPRSSHVNTKQGAVAVTTSSLAKVYGKKRIPQTTKAKRSDRQFQREEDSMSVSVRTISVAERVAFDKHRLPTVEEWQKVAKLHQERSSGSSSSHRRAKLSPSLQHLQLLHKMQSVAKVRQLAFSASCGLASDQLFVPPEGEEDFYDYIHFNRGQRSANSSRSHKRDGRYRSIDPVQATVSALPASPPLLSNKKHRLPMRSDVGFPNASIEEIQQKQTEIALETEWEEASPRLVVLVTSDDLGTAVQEEPSKGHPLIHLTRPWNGGGLDGMPWAGPELQLQKARNKRQFSGSNNSKGRGSRAQPAPISPIRGDSESSHIRDTGKLKVLQRLQMEPPPNRYSMLAPPLDATHSNTYCWRPRPFHDRQPEMNYAVACPVRLDFDIGNIEPLLCSMTLYNLPMSSTPSSAGRKVSEDYWFPAGDWKGRVDLASLSKSAGNVSTELLNTWRKRTHKAIFSYSCDALSRNPSQGFDDLHIVLQVYKVAHVDAASAYLAAGSASDQHHHHSLRLRLQKKFRKKGVENSETAEADTAARRTHYRANVAYDEFGTQLMTPLCFGVSKLIPSEPNDEPESMQWPKGAMQDMQLHCYPSFSMSQEDFCGRLSIIAASLPRYNPNTSGNGNENATGMESTSGVLYVMQGDEQPASLLTPGLSRSASTASSESSSPSVTSGAPTTDATPPPKLKGVRRFMHHRKQSRKDVTKQQQKQQVPQDDYVIAGKARIFTSSLPVDFLQSMLFTPPEIDSITDGSSKKPVDPTKRLARVLVDVSGDSAIMVDPRKDPTISSSGASADTFTGSASTIGDGLSRKRSSLIRLPSPKNPAAYSDAAEFREVLFLPPRLDKTYDTKDVPPSYRSFLNLLYLYPKLLKLDESHNCSSRSSKNSGNKHQRRGIAENAGDRQSRYTIRIRLVQSSTGLDKNSGLVESFNNVLDQFHNPAPWTGPALLNAVYTRIPGDGNSTLHHETNDGCDVQDDINAGIPLKDEFKLRLPMVLDGSYFLHFSLFSLNMHDDLGDSDSLSGGGSSKSDNGDKGSGISLLPLAETTIPLSSSSTRDSVTGIKSTTVIPNGCHRLKLGEFQLQLETRLVSSVHVSDAAVATALREFPLVASDDLIHGASSVVAGERLQELVLYARQTSASRASGGTGSVPDKVAYSSLFSKASANALIGHFEELLYLHLSNLVVSERSIPNVELSSNFLAENVLSLLEICRRIKSSFLFGGDFRQGMGRRRLEAFIKSRIDAFDEGLLCAGASPEHESSEEDAASEAPPAEAPRRLNSATHQTDLGDDERPYGEEFDGGAVRRRNRDSVRSGIDIRISRTFSAMESTTIVPFSRVAYGASKTDRMKLEAELHHENGALSYLVDDDEETVYTAASMLSVNDATIADARDAFAEKIKWGTTAPKEGPEFSGADASSVVESPADADPTLQLPDLRDWQSYSRTFGEFGLAKRVRHAAHVMLSPCVAPNVSTLFVARNSPPYFKPSDKQQFQSENGKSNLRERSRSPQNESSSNRNLHTAFSARSNEDEGRDKGVVESDHDQGFLSSEGIFRSSSSCHSLDFTIRPNHDHKQFEMPPARGAFLYESLMVLWLQTWADHAEHWADELRKPDVLVDKFASAIVIPAITMESPIGDAMCSFYAHMDVVLPLCLKSIVLRCSNAAQPSKAPFAKVVFDDGHMAVFEPFVEMISRALMGEALTGANTVDRLNSLLRAMYSADTVLDFLVGLAAVIHPAQFRVLLARYFTTLRDCETEHLETIDGDVAFTWSEESLHRVQCSRQLRIRAVERFAALPNFIGLNYPTKYKPQCAPSRPQSATWRMQHSDSEREAGHSSEEITNQYDDDDDRLPPSGWLANLLTSESLSVCALSCEAVVAEAMAHIETQKESPKTQSSKLSSLKKRPTAALRRSDLLMFQSVAIHAITCVHELLLRRHAMDMRFQREKIRDRIAALFARPIFEKSLASVRWLARMEATHKVRSLWLLCFMYVLQESPEPLIREALKSYSHPRNLRIQRFIRLLRLSSSTFQSFIDQPKHSMFPSEIDKGISPWLLQESFNTICATTIVVVEECAGPTAASPREQKKIVQGILDLLLHILTTPQSSVTHLRAAGGAIQALEKFGTAVFLEIAGCSLQHWIRVMLSLMNSIALSVRSIAVDFVVSLLGSTFDLMGNIDELALIFVTVLPEVVAREIGLYSVSGHISNLQDVEKAIWPLRRSFADVEDANPLDDDRVDPQLSPLLSVFCRACQAVIDGVLIEMRLQGNDCVVVGTRMNAQPMKSYTFDADEESLFEAASFFVPETAPMQRIRWLLTLKSLHEAKGQWVEAAETLMMCASTICDSIPHLRNVWRPSRFVLWSDARRSLWLSTVGEEMGNPELGNEQVMNFADNFLEHNEMIGSEAKTSPSGRLPQPTVSAMCKMLTNIAKEAVSLYQREGGVDELAYERLEALLKILMGVLDDHGSAMGSGTGSPSIRLGGNLSGKKRRVEDEAALRRVLASLSGDMTKLAERLLLIAQNKPTKTESGKHKPKQSTAMDPRQFYVRIHMSGKKPDRFKESTTVPTFLEWNTPCICRVPRKVVESSLAKCKGNLNRLEDITCSEFGLPIRNALLSVGATEPISLRTGSKGLQDPEPLESETTCVDISFVRSHVSTLEKNPGNDSSAWRHSKHFFYKKPTSSPTSEDMACQPHSPKGVSSLLVEMTLAHAFPCALSRQRSLLTSEFMSLK